MGGVGLRANSRTQAQFHRLTLVSEDGNASTTAVASPSFLACARCAQRALMCIDSFDTAQALANVSCAYAAVCLCSTKNI